MKIGDKVTLIRPIIARKAGSVIFWSPVMGRDYSIKGISFNGDGEVKRISLSEEIKEYSSSIFFNIEYFKTVKEKKFELFYNSFV